MSSQKLPYLEQFKILDLNRVLEERTSEKLILVIQKQVPLIRNVRGQYTKIVEASGMIDPPYFHLPYLRTWRGLEASGIWVSDPIILLIFTAHRHLGLGSMILLTPETPKVVRLGQVRLGWVGLGQVSLGQVRLGGGLLTVLVPDASPDPPIILWRILLIFTASGEGMWDWMEDPPYLQSWRILLIFIQTSWWILLIFTAPGEASGTRIYATSFHMRDSWEAPGGVPQDGGSSLFSLLIYNHIGSSFKGSLLRFQCSCLAYLHLLPLRSSTDFYE